MKPVIGLCLLAAVVITAPVAAADTSWKASGEIRHRFELDNRDFGNADAYTYGLLRSRLNLEFMPAPDVSAFVQVQDSRVMGEETSTLNDGSADNLDFHQAYVQMQDLFGLPVDAKLGRMEVNLGPQRLVGAVGWSNIGRSFDGAMARVKGGKVSAQLFFFTETESLLPGDTGDRRLLGAYGEITPMEGRVIHPFLIWQLRVPADDLSRYTLGFDTSCQRGGFWHELEFAYQGGDIMGAQRKHDIQAYMAALNLAYVFSRPKAQPKLMAGVDYLSGDDDEGTDDKIEVFDTLYATNHKYYGFMDLFTNIPANTYGGGLMDIHGGVAIKAGKKTTVSGVYHLFRAAEEVGIEGGGTSKDFGHEADLTVKHAYHEAVSFTAGASLFIPGTVFEERKGDDAATWAYLMTTVKL